MKLSVILSFLAIIQTSASVLSQSLTINVKNTSLRSVLYKIENQSKYRFFYNDQLSGLNNDISINAKKKDLDEILNKILENKGLTYKMLDNNMVVITPEKIAQKQKVSGTIKEVGTENPLAGVYVMIEGTSIGVTTDADGRYSIEVPNSNAVLVFSYMGFITQKVSVKGRTVIDLELSSDMKKLDEVVVVGYGQQKKVTVVGALSTVTTKDLKQSPTINLSNSLAGRIPGLIVTQYSGGEPGVDASSIYVRGMSTYNSSSQSPIVIVDGVERDFQYLNPDEVETITVLKDASSTAVYGVRGANGVILVTTRHGQTQDKPSVIFKAASGLSSAVMFPTYLGSADYAMLYNEARLNDDPNTTVKLFTSDQIENYRKAKGDNSDGLGYNLNLFDYAFKPSLQEDYSLRISGGSRSTRYFVLAGYMNQNGNYNHTDLSTYNTNATFKRYNFRSNIDIDITKNFYVKLDLGGRIQQRVAPGTTATRIVQICNTQPSIYPIILENNDNTANAAYEAKHPNGLLFGSQIYRYNILGELAYSGFINEYKAFMDGTFTMGHKLDFITQGLKIEGQFSYDNQQGNTIDRTVPHESEGYREYGGYATFYPTDGVDVFMDGGHYQGAYSSPRRIDDNTMNNSINTATPSPQRRNYGQLTLNYDRSFGLHTVSGLLMGDRSKRTYSNDVPYMYEGLA
ncbi:MAG: SusC/RagA family TonB-linked outer membrane protein, partial [Bacteroidota bacterium]|nr:SusC/RagA family TonB-linked outer membrane protein [Bacteroidota bacterium]